MSGPNRLPYVSDEAKQFIPATRQTERELKTKVYISTVSWVLNVVPSNYTRLIASNSIFSVS